MNFFSSKTKPAFGLDVSGNSFKVMQLQKKGGSVAVKACGSAPLSKGLVVNDVVADGKTFIYLLRQALEKPQFGHFDTNYVVASLPESKSFVRVIQIPKMSDSEAESAIPYEAESFIPLPIDQVYLDWQKIGETEDPSRLGGQAEADKMNILIIASPKEMVDKYLSILDEAKLKTVALEVESQSCLRALNNRAAKETFLAVDLEGCRSSLIMVEDGELQFTSTVPVAGSSFTESIAKALGVSSIKAEEIKKRVGVANTAQYPNIKIALLPILNNLSAEIKNILKFHDEHSGKKIGKILLVGGGAKLKNLAEFLTLQLASAASLSPADSGNIKIELPDPRQNLGKLENPPFDARESLSYVTSIGLAMRGINL